MPTQLPLVFDYTVQVEVEAEPDIVARVVADPHRYGLWQPEFEGARVEEGQVGTEGSVCRLRFGQEDGEDMEMTEEVLLSDLPRRHVTRFAWGSVRNEVDNTWSVQEDGLTRWVAHHVFEIDDLELATLAKDHPLQFRDATREAMHRLANYFAADGGAGRREELVRSGATVEDIEDFERRQIGS